MRNIAASILLAKQTKGTSQMDTKSNSKSATKRSPINYFDSFLVTREVVVGQVNPTDGHGDFLTPVHAAMDIIASEVASDSYGVFRFPVSGGTLAVHVAKEGDNVDA